MDRVLALDLDMARPDQIEAVVAAAVVHFGRIDVLVNNAGYGYQSSVEEGIDAEIRAQFEANVFGLFAITRAVLPVMREQRSGHIINITSVAGLIGFPGSGCYAASKHAVEGFYCEWMPVRVVDTTNLRKNNRSRSFGKLANLVMLEERLNARSEQLGSNIANPNGYFVQSGAYADPTGAVAASLRPINPHFKYINLEKRGYMLVDVDPARAVCEWWHLDTVASSSNIESFAVAFEVRDGTNRLMPSTQTTPRADPPALAP